MADDFIVLIINTMLHSCLHIIRCLADFSALITYKNIALIYKILFLPTLDLEFKNSDLSFFKHVWLLKLEGCHVDSYLCINLPSATFSGNQQLNFQPYSLPLFDKAQWLVLLVFLVAIFQAIFKWSLLFHKHHRSTVCMWFYIYSTLTISIINSKQCLTIVARKSFMNQILPSTSATNTNLVIARVLHKFILIRH